MDALYSATGKRTRTENDFTENNDRNKKRNSGSGREQAFPAADSTVYRILCPGNVIGNVIGKGGKVIKSLRQETRAKIKVANPVPGVDERVIVIFSSPTSKDKENEKDDEDGNGDEPICPAQDALLRVHSVIVQESSGRENDVDKKQHNARLLVANSQIGSLIGKGGNNIQKLRSESGAQIQIPRKNELPGCAFTFDELVQISGDATAVKKALYAVSAFLYKHSPKEQIPWSDILSATNQSSLVPSGVSAFPPANYLPQGDSLFGHHSLGAAPILGYTSHLSGLGGYGSEAASAWPLSNTSLSTLSKYGNSAAKKSPEEFSIRVLCPNDKIGGVIGKGGNTIKTMRKDTGASIRVEDAQSESDERIIVVSASELADDRVSPTIEAVVQLQGKTSGTTDKEGAISTRFLVPSRHIGCLIGKGGNIISEMRKQTRANIRIFRKDERPKCASENEELVQITGEPSVARDALIQIITRLREDIFKERDGASNTDTVLPLSSVIPLSSSYGTRQYDIGSPRGTIAGRSAAGLSSFGSLQSGTGSYAPLQSYAPAYAPTRTFGLGLNGGHLKSSLGSYEVAIPNSAVSSVLGRGGSNISHIREISGATVKLRDPITGASERVIEISGTPEQSQAAQSLIHAYMLTGQSQQSRVTARTY